MLPSSTPLPGEEGSVFVPTWSSKDFHGAVEKSFQVSVQ